MGTQFYVSRRTFGYVPGVRFSRGQLVELRNARNDEKLIRLGYVLALKAKPPQLWECRGCGAKFIGMGERDGHYEAAHLKQPEIPAMPKHIGGGTRMVDDIQSVPEAAADDRTEEREDKTSPLYMHKTKAAFDSGTGIYEITPPTKKRSRRKAKGRRRKAARKPMKANPPA